MKVPFNDLARAARHQADELHAILGDVVASGWFVHGPHHRDFESGLASYLGGGRVLGVASGTDALEIAVRTVAVAPNRTVVITVANAGGYTTCAAVAAGLPVRFCDVDPNSHTMDPLALEPLLDESVAVVVVTHLYGRMADVRAIRQLCDPLGIHVIEDCAQSLGARDGQGMAGSIGDIATFSFYPTKNLGALGDGGAIAINDPELVERALQLRQYGWSAKYRNAIPCGKNSRLDELQAAVLNHRLERLDSDNEIRRSIIKRYATAAASGVTVLPADGFHHVGHLAVVVTDDAAQLAQHLARHDIATDVHYPTPDHQQPAWSTADISLPVTESLVGRVLSLPCFPDLSDDEIDHVCAALRSFQE